MRRLRIHSITNYAHIASFSFASLAIHYNSIHTHPNHHFLSVLKHPSSSRRVTQQIHAQLTTNGSLNQCPDTQIIFIFNTLLRHYAVGEFPQEALFLYKQATPLLCSYFDSFTYSFLIKSCANFDHRFTGIQLHGKLIQLGFERHVYVQTALLNMYVDFGELSDAHRVFDEMPDRNEVSWNVMVTGLVRWGYLDKALDLFWKMPSKNVVSWTGIIDGFVQMRNYAGAFSLFKEMIIVGEIMPTEVTFLSILRATAELGDLQNCRSIHAYSGKCGFHASYVKVANCLTNTYAKCGCISSALRVFEEIDADRRDLVSWTSIISGFAMHGMAKEAAESFRKMQCSGVRPNRISFLSVLNAYSHGGLVQEGLQFFERMVDEGIVEPDIKHYGSVIDMLGRAGKLQEAQDVACRMPDHIDSLIVWRTLLGACSIHGNPEIGEFVGRKIQEMQSGYGGDYVLMSNILTGKGKFLEAASVRTLMDRRNVLKTSAHSSV